MSAVYCLAKSELLGPETFQQGAELLHDLKYPKDSVHVRDLIQYFFLMQCTFRTMGFRSRYDSVNEAANLQNLIQQLDATGGSASTVNDSVLSLDTGDFRIETGSGQYAVAKDGIVTDGTLKIRECTPEGTPADGSAVARRSFFYDGTGVDNEWTEDGQGRLLHHSGESLGGYTYHLGIYPDHPPVFQNPYPWGKSYRFPYQDLFGQLPSPM